MLEAIVACGVIITAVCAALTLVRSSLSGAKTSEDNIVAFNLAREGVEAVRQIRDSNWLAARNFDDGLEGPSFQYYGWPSFDPDNKKWSVIFTSHEWTDAGTRVYRQMSGGGAAVPGMFLQAPAQPNGTEVTRFRRRLALRALCSQAAGSDDNFVNYYVRDSGSGCGAGDDKIGIEINSYVRWPKPDGTNNEVRVIEKIFDWR